MVHEITHSGIIVALAPPTSARVDELIALCDWPVISQPTARTLFQQIEAHRPTCLLFWLEADSDITPAAQLVSLLRDRGARPYRIAVAHCLDASVEQTFRSAGVHSYFAVTGNLRALVDEALLPIVDLHRAPSRTRTTHARDVPVAIRGPTEARASPAPMRPP